MTFSNIGQLNAELSRRCQALDLGFDCGADGVFNAEIAIIGEAPGEREKYLKSPLIGQSGKLFWEKVRPLGISRRNTYVTNVSKRQLLTVGDEKSFISPNELSHYTELLLFELAQLPKLRFIVVLGNYALQAVTGLTGISNYRGSVVDVLLRSSANEIGRDVRVMCLVNPAAVMREPKWEIVFNFDVGKLKRLLNGTYADYHINTLINPSFNEATRWIDKMQDEQLPVAVDIETISGETACIGFANNKNEAMCINLRTATANHYSATEETLLYKRMQRFFNDPKTQLVAQNGMFDGSWLWYWDRLRIPRFWYDTMLAHHTLYPSLPHNLGFLTSQYTTHPFYKDEGKDWKEGGNIDDFWRYNGKDCCITLAVQQATHKELQAQQLEEFFFSHVMPLQPELIKMTVGGLLVDQGLKDEIRFETNEEVKRLKEEFWKIAQAATNEGPDYKPNPASPKQMHDLYFNKLRLIGRGTATDVKNRLRMKMHPRTPAIAKELLNSQDRLAKEQKFLGTYAEMQVDDDGRIRAEYKQIGVVNAPGRLSSSATLWGSGTNLQNQPERAHKFFLADPGYEFSYFDLSQAEARVVGWHYAINSWIEQFEQARIDGKYDAHRALASMMFDVPYDEVPLKDWNPDGTPTIRYLAKRCRHGLNYMMGPEVLMDSINTDKFQINEDRAQELYRMYHRINPELKRGWEWTFSKVKNERKLFNAFGRRWILLEKFDDNALKSVIAFYPQSTIGDKVSWCIHKCHNDPEWPRGHARMALTIHDALIALNRPQDRELVQAIMRKYAEAPMYIDCIDGIQRELIVPAEFKVSVPGPDGLHRWSTIGKG